jgi:PAS domain S-box-containing protein
MRATLDSILTVSSLDPGDARRRKLLNILLTGVAALCLLIVVYGAISIAFFGVPFDQETQLLYISIGITLTAILVIYLINRFWSGLIGASLFLAVLIGTMAYGDSPENIVAGRVLFLFTIPVIMASVLIRPWASFIVAAIVTAVLTERGSQIGEPFNPVSFSGFMAIALVSWLAARSLEAALTDLQHINKELDNLVSERTRELFDALKQVSAESSKNQAILESIADGVIVFDEQGNAFTANAAIADLIERPINHIVGGTIGTLLAQDVNAEDRERVLEHLRVGERSKENIRIDWGSKKVLSLTFAAVRNASKELIGTVMVFRDFTREAELERMKSAFVSMASHELRTPLNAILGYSDMLREGVYGSVEDQQRNILERVIANVNRMLGLVNNLLDQAQIEAGGLKPNWDSVSIRKVTQDVQGTMKVLAQMKGLNLGLAIADDVPEELSSDPQRLQQILINLIGNAIKFTEKGGIDIRVYCPDKDHWAMDIADTGPGIPSEAVGYVFEPFRQVDSDPVKRKHGGSGLGLSIVKQLTELLGGHISLTSEVGTGTIFTAVFPLVPVKEQVA